MNYFLKTIAKYLYNNYKDSFKDISLIFPNKRSGVLFQNELNKLVTNKPIWSPRINTINEFMLNYADLDLSNHIELLTELYLTHKKVSGSNESFDNFYHWGEIILTDFNDIDKYLVDAKSLFVNIKHFKEFENKIDFLSKEQINTLKRFFEAFNVEDSSKIKKEFAKIWDIMFPLYSNFKSNLISKNIGYEGMVYENALKNIKQLNIADYSFKKIFFIGFNAITPIEEEVFNILKNIELAEFFWDYDEYYISNKQIEAGLFQRKYLKKFPPVNISKNTNQLKGKKIKIISTPTDHGQIFLANQILQTIPNNDISNSAVILSDEQLLLPMLNNIPDNIKDTNITMGYPITNSLTNNFIEFLIQIQINSQSKKNGEVSFYYKNVISILNHPFTEYLCKDVASDITNKVTSENIYQVNIKEFNKHIFLEKIFKKIKTTDEFKEYLENQIKYLHEQLWLLENNDDNLLIEKEFIFKIWAQIQTLNNQLVDSGIELKLNTYFNLLRKVIQTTRIPFDGEPVKGLQIMGFLETRNLDFKNVIITSVNEGIIPKQNKTSSFIPFSLRRGFKLPTGELNDAMYAYYFYRILQSADNIWLIYNSGSSGITTNEKSRLIYQLEYDDNFITSQDIFTQTIDVTSNRNISIEKNGATWNKLQEFINSETKKLSPSALSIYLQCPLQFYFKSIARITEPDQITETVDARLFGNIFHNSAESIYTLLSKDNQLITSELLNMVLKDKKTIDAVIFEAFNKVFYGEKTEKQFKIDGKNTIIFNIIKKYLKQMLKKDIEYTPFSIVGLEYNVKTNIEIDIDNTKNNIQIGGQIDRIDKTDYSLRIIDYKTGKNERNFNILDDVFSSEKIKKTKAIFQTFIYSYIISKTHIDENIEPMIYSVKELFKKDNSFDITSKKDITYKTDGFLGIKSNVEQYLKELLEELFNKNVPFKQTEDIKTCEYCMYKDMCGR